MLNLANNQLSILPPEVGQLSNLQVLYLAENQLNTLPSEIAYLRKLCLFSADKNIHPLPTLLTRAECSDVISSVINYHGASRIFPNAIDAIISALHNPRLAPLQWFMLQCSGGVGLLALLILGFRHKQRGARKEKPKRDAA